jgi:hypothetical protein
MCSPAWADIANSRGDASFSRQAAEIAAKTELRCRRWVFALGDAIEFVLGSVVSFA